MYHLLAAHGPEIMNVYVKKTKQTLDVINNDQWLKITVREP